MDWFSDVLGFLVILLVLFVPLLRKLFIDVKRVKEKEKERQKGKPPARRPPQTLALPQEAKREHHTTSRVVKKDFEYHSEIEEREKLGTLDERHLESQIAPEFREKITSEAFVREQKKVRRKKSLRVPFADDPLKSMVIYSEILKKPKGL